MKSILVTLTVWLAIFLTAPAAGADTCQSCSPSTTCPEGYECIDGTCGPAPERALGTDETLVLDGEMENPGGDWKMSVDPDVVRLGNRWWMLFTSLNLKSGKLHIMTATLPPGAKLESNDWTITRDENGAPLPLLQPGEAGAWDERAVETAKHVVGYDNAARRWVSRIYFTGWRQDDRKRKVMSIGYAEWNEATAAYQKAPFPTLVGYLPWELYDGVSFVGDQAVFYEPGNGPSKEGGTWHMWYLANSGAGSSQAVRLGHATSLDGVNWTSRQPLIHSNPFFVRGKVTGPLHPDMMPAGNGTYHFLGTVLASDDPSTCEDDFRRQGLYLAKAYTLDSSDRSNFNTFLPVVYEFTGDGLDPGYRQCLVDKDELTCAGFIDRNRCRCHMNGIIGATIEYDNDLQEMFVFFSFRSSPKETGRTPESTHWPNIARVRLQF